MEHTFVLDIETAGTQDSDAFDPTKGRIVAIGVKNETTEAVFTAADEAALLKDFWNAFSPERPPTFVTYNGASFDMNWIVFRSLVHGMRVPAGFLERHIDMMLLLFQSGARFRSKDSVCMALGIAPPASPFTGADIPRLWREGKFGEIEAHCRDDIRREWELFKRMKECGLV